MAELILTRLGAVIMLASSVHIPASTALVFPALLRQPHETDAEHRARLKMAAVKIVNLDE